MVCTLQVSTTNQSFKQRFTKTSTDKSFLLQNPCTSLQSYTTSKVAMKKHYSSTKLFFPSSHGISGLCLTLSWCMLPWVIRCRLASGLTFVSHPFPMVVLIREDHAGWNELLSKPLFAFTKEKRTMLDRSESPTANGLPGKAISSNPMMPSPGSKHWNMCGCGEAVVSYSTPCIVSLFRYLQLCNSCCNQSIKHTTTIYWGKVLHRIVLL